MENKENKVQVITLKPRRNDFAVAVKVDMSTKDSVKEVLQFARGNNEVKTTDIMVAFRNKGIGVWDNNVNRVVLASDGDYIVREKLSMSGRAVNSVYDTQQFKDFFEVVE